MQNELKYTVRSREIVDLMQAMRTSRLTLSPYFQRNLVWRDSHRRDFIDTILKGYPFPQIFLARGPIDLETMSSSQAVVDGQQRLNTIRDFINGKLTMDGKTFRDMSVEVREEFLKYEVAVIDFDLDVGDPRLKDVFHRLNRTFYSLSAIEKLASEYSASEYMLVARILSGEILKAEPTDDELGDIGSETGEDPIPSNMFSRDPGIDQATWDWLLERAEGSFASLIRSMPVFSSFEFDRKVPLMFTLNIMSTYLVGYYNRNDKVRKFLDERATEFPEKDEVIAALNSAADFIVAMALPPKADSPWWNKANFFTIVAELTQHPDLCNQDPLRAAGRLMHFLGDMPADYAIAQKEGTGQKTERERRGTAILAVLTPSAVDE